MRTGAEPFAGPLVWTAFPAIPSVPPSFPLGRCSIRRKHHAGVAELVDALDLGSGRRPNTIKALGGYLKALWGLACKAPAKPRPFLPLTQTSIAAQTSTAGGNEWKPENEGWN